MKYDLNFYAKTIVLVVFPTFLVSLLATQLLESIFDGLLEYVTVFCASVVVGYSVYKWIEWLFERGVMK